MNIQTSAVVLALLGTPLCHAGGTLVTPIDTTTTLRTSHNPVAVGEVFSLTATVTAASGAGPTGSVTFRSLPSRAGQGFGVQNLPMWQMGSAPLEGQGISRTATIRVRSAEALIHYMTASYSGDGINAKSQPPTLQLNVYKRNAVVQPELITEVAPAVETPLEDADDDGLEKARMLRDRHVF